MAFNLPADEPLDFNTTEMNYNGVLDIDLSDAIKCTTSAECPADSRCADGDIDMKNMCICVHGLTVAKLNESCPDKQPTLDPDISKEASGVIPLPFGNGFRDPFFPTNDTQTTSNVLPGKPVTDEGSDIIIKVVLSLAGTIFLCLLVLGLICWRYRYCRKQTRGKGSAVVKASEGLHLLDKINVVNKNPTYFVSNSTGYQVKSDVINIPAEEVRLLEVVGEGAFGQVYKGELEIPGNSARCNVAVKVLKEGVSNEAKDDFEREVEIMSAFDHENILKLLGTVQSGSTDMPYMVFEYMKHGDLAELLRKNDPSIRRTDDTLVLEKIDLVDITIQIANGMKYLTSQHFVHRDLATRNCLVGAGLVVKISDFGMSRDIYTCDYYRIGGSRMLPVRWMSPEAVKWGRFTTDSDIWAFGVVLWEIFSYGRQPYYGHSNEEVIRFLDEGILLQRPDECPSIVYHVMLQCWKLDAIERLAFGRIHKYLTEYSKQLSKNSRNSSLDLVNEYEIPL